MQSSYTTPNNSDISTPVTKKIQLRPCSVKAAGCAGWATLCTYRMPELKICSPKCQCQSQSQSGFLLFSLQPALSSACCLPLHLQHWCSTVGCWGRVACILFTWICSAHSLCLRWCSTNEIRAWVYFLQYSSVLGLLGHDDFVFFFGFLRQSFSV